MVALGFVRLDWQAIDMECAEGSRGIQNRVCLSTVILFHRQAPASNGGN
jgi:hypothetical protein